MGQKSCIELEKKKFNRTESRFQEFFTGGVKWPWDPNKTNCQYCSIHNVGNLSSTKTCDGNIEKVKKMCIPLFWPFPWVSRVLTKYKVLAWNFTHCWKTLLLKNAVFFRPKDNSQLDFWSGIGIATLHFLLLPMSFWSFPRVSWLWKMCKYLFEILQIVQKTAWR